MQYICGRETAANPAHANKVIELMQTHFSRSPVSSLVTAGIEAARSTGGGHSSILADIDETLQLHTTASITTLKSIFRALAYDPAVRTPMTEQAYDELVAVLEGYGVGVRA